MKINRLPGTRGSFTAKTAKKTKMFVYQVNGSEQDKALFMQYKRDVEGYEPMIDMDFGLLHTTNRNVGKQGDLDVYVNSEGVLETATYNAKLREIEELRAAGVSPERIDEMIIKALSEGSYAKPITDSGEVTSNKDEDKDKGEDMLSV